MTRILLVDDDPDVRPRIAALNAAITRCLAQRGGDTDVVPFPKP